MKEKHTILILALLWALPASSIPIEVPPTGTVSASGSYSDAGLTWNYDALTFRHRIAERFDNGVPVIGTFVVMDIAAVGTLSGDFSHFPITGPTWGGSPGFFVDGQASPGFQCSPVFGCRVDADTAFLALSGFNVWAAHWGEDFDLTIGGDTYEFGASMPEPGAAVLMLLGLAGLAWRTRRRGFPAFPAVGAR